MRYAVWPMQHLRVAKRGFRGKGFQKIVLNNQPTLPLVELKFFTVQAANLKILVIRGD